MTFFCNKINIQTSDSVDKGEIYPIWHFALVQRQLQKKVHLFCMLLKNVKLINSDQLITELIILNLPGFQIDCAACDDFFANVTHAPNDSTPIAPCIHPL